MCCNKTKGTKSFKNSAKTLDGKYPFCKACEYTNKFYSRKDRHNVAFRLWRELLVVAEESDVGKQVVYMNKTLFTKWLFIHPKFEKLYRQYVESDFDKEKDFHIFIPDKSSPIDFSNLYFTLCEGIEEIPKLFDPEE